MARLVARRWLPVTDGSVARIARPPTSRAAPRNTNDTAENT